MFVPKLRSKIAAMHAEGSLGSVPMFMSEALMGHNWPPNDSETSRFVEQAVQWEWECVSQSVLLRPGQSPLGMMGVLLTEIEKALAAGRVSSAHCRLDGCDIGARAANERRAGVDRRERSVARRNGHRAAVHRDACQRKRSQLVSTACPAVNLAPVKLLRLTGHGQQPESGRGPGHVQELDGA